MQSGLKNAYESIKAFSETDFTADLQKIDVPTLVMHGEDDQIVTGTRSCTVPSRTKPRCTACWPRWRRSGWNYWSSAACPRATPRQGSRIPPRRLTPPTAAKTALTMSDAPNSRGNPAPMRAKPAANPCPARPGHQPAIPSPGRQDSRRDRKCRSARLERTVPKGLFQYRTAVPVRMPPAMASRCVADHDGAFGVSWMSRA